MVTAGEVIKNKRESLGKDLNTVSIDTKIQRRFLQYIEDNQFDKFDSEVFATGFIKIYSKYLGLDVEKILALYRRSNLNEIKKVKKETSRKKIKYPNFNISPKLIAIVTLIVFFALIIGYVGYQIYKFQTPPTLTILEPTNEFVTNEDTIMIKGTTQALVLVDINGDPAEVDELGMFESEITLNPGVNTIVVKARKTSNTSLEKSVTLKVIFSPENGEDIEEEKTEYMLTLSISQSAAWIKLDIDDENKISQVLQSNTIHEFKVLNKFTLVTGRLQNTKLEINGEEIPLTSSNLTGIAQVSCEVVENELKCQ